MRLVYPSLCLSAYHRSTRLRLHHGLLLQRRAQLGLALSLVAVLPISLVLPNLHVQMQRHMRTCGTCGAHAHAVHIAVHWQCTCSSALCCCTTTALPLPLPLRHYRWPSRYRSAAPPPAHLGPEALDGVQLLAGRGGIAVTLCSDPL